MKKKALKELQFIKKSSKRVLPREYKGQKKEPCIEPPTASRRVLRSKGVYSITNTDFSISYFLDH